MTATATIRDRFAVGMVRRQLEQQRRSQLRQYRDNPIRYGRNELGVRWWRKQREVARALLSNQRVMVRASHSVGKTHLAGGLVNWFYDISNPGIVLTTAPTSQQVKDLLWAEVRKQRKGGDLYPKAPRMESAPNHYAVGYTARDSDAFQGRHEESLFIIFDEAVGIAAEFWEGANGMLTSGTLNWFLAIYNPTETASAAYDEEQIDGNHVIQISALDHPNIYAELRGWKPPIPQAVSLSWVQERIDRWCEQIDPADATPDDIEWPPKSGEFYKPGPLFESRVMGRWPTSATSAVWSEAVFTAAAEAKLDEPDVMPEVGCDVARFGDDYTSIHTRRGMVSLAHETHNGWDTVRVAERLMTVAGELGKHASVDRKRVPLKIDDDGVGGGVVDYLRSSSYNVQPINAGSASHDPTRYRNRRSEMWFDVMNLAKDGLLDLSRLDKTSLSNIRRQCMAPKWKVIAGGQREVEPKEQTKKRLRRSPDDADAMNLAYAIGPTVKTIQTDWW